MSFFKIFSMLTGTFMGLPLWLKIAVLAALLLIGIPPYLWMGNKAGKRAYAFLGAAWDLLMKRRNSFWMAYDLNLDNWDSVFKTLWPVMLCLLALLLVITFAIVAIIRIVRLVVRFSKFWGRLVKKCWQ